MEWHLVLEFLEDEKNYNIITGKATKGRPVQGGLAITKAHGFTAMATFINERVPEQLQDWNKRSAKNRFESYLRSFKAAFAWDGDKDGGQSGQGLTAKDISNGITTVAAKLEKLCFNYERMKALFRGRQNIEPSHVSVVGGLESSDLSPQAASAVDDEGDVELDEASDTSSDDETKLHADPDVQANSDDEPCVVQTELNAHKRKVSTKTDRATGRKDFVSAYEAGQNKMLDLKREKFEHSKEIRELKMKQAMTEARANFVVQLMRDGHSMDHVKEAVRVAFPDD
ncbi:unnamed protein product [Aphanomyces euteiches]|nr:hypothetical protein Ae201684P_009228 [Aphanomyces euteiches]KAH9156717.1 hypothetical protein AeRB84_001405 [Aphanomyces euteiches]